MPFFQKKIHLTVASDHGRRHREHERRRRASANHHQGSAGPDHLHDQGNTLRDRRHLPADDATGRALQGSGVSRRLNHRQGRRWPKVYQNPTGLHVREQRQSAANGARARANAPWRSSVKIYCCLSLFGAQALRNLVQQIFIPCLANLPLGTTFSRTISLIISCPANSAAREVMIITFDRIYKKVSTKPSSFDPPTYNGTSCQATQKSKHDDQTSFLKRA